MYIKTCNICFIYIYTPLRDNLSHKCEGLSKQIKLYTNSKLCIYIYIYITNLFNKP